MNFENLNKDDIEIKKVGKDIKLERDENIVLADGFLHSEEELPVEENNTTENERISKWKTLLKKKDEFKMNEIRKQVGLPVSDRETLKEDNGSSEEKEEKIIDLTEEEARLLAEGDENDPAIQKLMKEKGIPNNEEASSFKVRINGVVQEAVNKKGFEEAQNKWLKESSSGIAEILNEQFSEGIDFINEEDIKEQYLSFLEQGKPAFLNEKIGKNSTLAKQVILAGARLAIEDLEKNESSVGDNKDVEDKISRIKSELGNYMIDR